jgi:SAM-dependent methyltransferase
LDETRINPSISNSRYLILTHLSSNIKEIAERTTKGKKPLKVLDVGCGLKPYQPYFKNTDVYLGIDRAFKTKKTKAMDVVAVAEKIPFKDHTFSIVLCTQVLEHTISPEETLKEVYRVVEDKGKLILTTHGIWTEGHESPDLWRWTAEGLKRMLSLVGFEIEEVHSMDAVTSLFQLMLLYVPSGGISKYVINPILNIVAKTLNRVPTFTKLGQIGPRLHVVHVILSSKR